MLIESNPQPTQTVEFKPYFIGETNRDEFEARQKLLADDIDYAQGTSDPIEKPTIQPMGSESIVAPQLESKDAEVKLRVFENNVPPAHELLQLEPLPPTPREPRHQL